MYITIGVALKPNSISSLLLSEENAYLKKSLYNKELIKFG